MLCLCASCSISRKGADGSVLVFRWVRWWGGFGRASRGGMGGTGLQGLWEPDLNFRNSAEGFLVAANSACSGCGAVPACRKDTAALRLFCSVARDLKSWFPCLSDFSLLIRSGFGLWFCCSKCHGIRLFCKELKSLSPDFFFFPLDCQELTKHWCVLLQIDQIPRKFIYNQISKHWSI